MFDYIIVGAGPAGLACAVEAKKKGSSCLVLEKGCIVNSIFNFPADMTFFSTPELLEIGELVFVTDSFRPNRFEVLNYYLAVVKHYELNIAQNNNVTKIEKLDDGFKVTSRHHNVDDVYQTKKLILAMGYYDNPNKLNIEGENLEKVSHYYHEAHSCFGLNVAIIGGKNSAVEAALSFYHKGANVTLIHRGESLSDSVKYWIRPEIEKRIENKQIKTFFNSHVAKIESSEICIRENGDEKTIKNDKVFALTGYRPNIEFLKQCKIKFDESTLAPIHNELNLETNIPGLHIAGSVVAGMNCNKIFIENSREHGRMIVG